MAFSQSRLPLQNHLQHCIQPWLIQSPPASSPFAFAVVVLVLFGRGKISSLMGEVGKGITAFKKGVNDGAKQLEDEAVESAKDVTPDEDKDNKA